MYEDKINEKFNEVNESKQKITKLKELYLCDKEFKLKYEEEINKSNQNALSNQNLDIEENNSLIKENDILLKKLNHLDLEKNTELELIKLELAKKNSECERQIINVEIKEFELEKEKITTEQKFDFIFKEFEKFKNEIKCITADNVSIKEDNISLKTNVNLLMKINANLSLRTLLESIVKKEMSIGKKTLIYKENSFVNFKQSLGVILNSDEFRKKKIFNHVNICKELYNKLSEEIHNPCSTSENNTKFIFPNQVYIDTKSLTKEEKSLISYLKTKLSEIYNEEIEFIEII